MEERCIRNAEVTGSRPVTSSIRTVGGTTVTLEGDGRVRVAHPMFDHDVRLSLDVVAAIKQLTQSCSPGCAVYGDPPGSCDCYMR